MLCPLSIEGVEGVTPPATNPATTVTVSPAEHWDPGEKEESVALYEYVVLVLGEAA
jgi:hypothetical protein